MATATAREFEGDGNGQHRKDEIIERARSFAAGEYDVDPERLQNVGGAVLRTEFTPHGWGRQATNAGYLALRRTMPEFNTYPPEYSPLPPHGNN